MKRKIIAINVLVILLAVAIFTLVVGYDSFNNALNKCAGDRVSLSISSDTYMRLLEVCEDMRTNYQTTCELNLETSVGRSQFLEGQLDSCNHGYENMRHERDEALADVEMWKEAYINKGEGE